MSKPTDGFLPARQQPLGLVNSIEWLSIRKHNGLEIWFLMNESLIFIVLGSSFASIWYSFLTFNSLTRTQGEKIRLTSISWNQLGVYCIDHRGSSFLVRFSSSHQSPYRRKHQTNVQTHFYLMQVLEQYFNE